MCVWKVTVKNYVGDWAIIACSEGTVLDLDRYCWNSIFLVALLYDICCDGGEAYALP